MDPFSIIIVQLGATAVRSLVLGQAPDRADWATSSVELLKGLAAAQPETDRTLSRIEERLDRLEWQLYRSKLRGGQHRLEQATHCDQAERVRLIALARADFTDAVAAAPDLRSGGIAEWHLAMTYLLTQSVAPSLAALNRAKDCFLSEALAVVPYYTTEPQAYDPAEYENTLRYFSQQTASVDRALHAVGVGRETAESRAKSLARHYISLDLERLVKWHARAQIARVKLGEQPVELFFLPLRQFESSSTRSPVLGLIWKRFLYYGDGSIHVADGTPGDWSPWRSATAEDHRDLGKLV